MKFSELVSYRYYWDDTTRLIIVYGYASVVIMTVPEARRSFDDRYVSWSRDNVVVLL